MAQLFKTNDVVSKRDVISSNVLFVNILPFFGEKSEGLLHCKSTLHFFSKNITEIDFVGIVRLDESMD